MSVTDEIKARLDIVNFISQYVPLKKTGRNYKAPCPFHTERTPSFVVFPDTQNWHCFGACGEGGDIFNFVMKQEGLDFASALRTLAEKAGVELHERTLEQINQDEKLDKLRGLLEESARFFHDKIWESPEGDHALAYARKRGLTDETLAHFGIGYAPDDWQRALGHLLSLGYSEDEAVEAGVAIRNEKGHVYDRFRNRLMIPIRDGRGLVIGFGARALNPDDNPKYLNSPQTPLFDKSATLFGLNFARRAIREGETAVIVEGYMDAIQAHQAGFTNVVAEMGTALTETQLKQLSTYARRLILALDPDIAGIKATMRGLNVARQTLGDSALVFDPRGIMRHASKLGIEILVITVPGGQDPDDLIRDHPDEWQKLIETAQSVADYVIAAGTVQITPQSTFSEREQVARELLPILMATENDLQQHYNIQRLALRLHLDERTLIGWTQKQQSRAARFTPRPPSALQAAPPAPSASPSATPTASPSVVQSPSTRAGQIPPGSVAERYCLAMLIRFPDLLYVANRRLRELAARSPKAREALGALSADDFMYTDFRGIFNVLERALAQDDHEPLEYLERHLPYELFTEVNNLLVEPLDAFKQRLTPSLHAQLEAEVEAARKKKEWMTTGSSTAELEFVHRILGLRVQRLRRDNQTLFFLIQDAAQNGDSESEARYNRQSNMNTLAIKLIDQAVNQVAQIQREQ